MLIVISSARTFNLKPQKTSSVFTQPEFQKQSEKLIHELRKLKPQHLAELLDINHQLALLNYEHHHQWHLPFTSKNARQAIYTYSGEVYRGINIKNYSDKDILYLQDHLRIISGLYGILRPLDLIQPYRLEMQSELNTSEGENMYQFWGKSITEALNKILKQQKIKTLINLASHEYFKIIKTKDINAKIITPVFYQNIGGNNKAIVVYLKKARGMMTSFIIKNKLTDPTELVHFDWEGYAYAPEKSDDDTMVFVR